MSIEIEERKKVNTLKSQLSLLTIQRHLNHLLAGCHCRGWQLRKDKFALEDKEPG